jgi:hypothetical protein
MAGIFNMGMQIEKDFEELRGISKKFAGGIKKILFMKALFISKLYMYTFVRQVSIYRYTRNGSIFLMNTSLLPLKQPCILRHHNLMGAFQFVES